MRPELENIELIDKYLRGQLSEDEKISFENNLKIDKQLKSEVKKQE